VSRFLVGATWSDVPHLTLEAQESLWASIPPYQRDARSKGIPQLGAGAIYPLPESDIRVQDFAIPPHWPRGFGMDVGGGAKPTAAAWFTQDPATSTLYLYACYKRSAVEPSINAAAIRAKGAWIPGVADAAALIVTEHDAEQLVSVYRRLGLDLQLPDKAVEAGIQDVWELLSTGRLKVFGSCVDWLAEFRMYRRDARGRIVKKNDHLMDGTRYFIRRRRWRVLKTGPEKPQVLVLDSAQDLGLDWM